MKHNYNHSSRKVIPYTPRRATAYPNAAQRSDRLHKLLDYALTAATSAGLVTILLCLFTFF